MILAILTLAQSPAASASATDMCLREETLILPGPRYVLVDTVEASTWGEANGLPGLQTRACTDAAGRERAADAMSVGTGRVDDACLEAPWTCAPPQTASTGLAAERYVGGAGGLAAIAAACLADTNAGAACFPVPPGATGAWGSLFDALATPTHAWVVLDADLTELQRSERCGAPPATFAPRAAYLALDLAPGFGVIPECRGPASTGVAVVEFVMPPAAASASSSCLAEQPDAPVYLWSRFGAPTQSQVWRESNSMPGLQRDGCVDADGRPVAADTLEAGTPEVWPPCSRPPRPIVCLF